MLSEAVAQPHQYHSAGLPRNQKTLAATPSSHPHDSVRTDLDQQVGHTKAMKLDTPRPHALGLAFHSTGPQKFPSPATYRHTRPNGHKQDAQSTGHRVYDTVPNPPSWNTPHPQPILPGPIYTALAVPARLLLCGRPIDPAPGGGGGSEAEKSVWT